MTTVKVQPPGIVYVLEKAVLDATNTTGTWCFTPPRGAYIVTVGVQADPTTAGTLGWVRTIGPMRLPASANAYTEMELDYSTPNTGAESVNGVSIACYLDGKQTLKIRAKNTGAGNLPVQGAVILYPATPQQNPARDQDPTVITAQVTA